MLNFLTATELGLAINFLVFVFTLIFSQKIKDFLSGVPRDLRTGLKGVEQNILADVKDYQADLIAKITPPVIKPTTPAA